MSRSRKPTGSAEARWIRTGGRRGAYRYIETENVQLATRWCKGIRLWVRSRSITGFRGDNEVQGHDENKGK